MENVKNLEKTIMYCYLRNHLLNNLYANAFLLPQMQSQSRSFNTIFPPLSQNSNLANFYLNASIPAFSRSRMANSTKFSSFSAVQPELNIFNPFDNNDKRKYDSKNTLSRSKQDYIHSKHHKSNTTLSNDEIVIEEDEERKYKCKHRHCGIGFKTKRQSIMHHNKFEPECKADRNAIVRVLGKYKALLKKIIKTYGLNKEKIVESEIYKKLEKKFEEIKSNLVDPEYFSFIDRKSVV